MDIHVLCHGFGNQLSQYAFFLNRRALGQRAYSFYAFEEHNGFELQRLFGLTTGLPWYLQFVRVLFRLGLSRRFCPESAIRRVFALFRVKLIVEPSDYAFDPEHLKPWFGMRIFFGGWHDARYYHPSENEVKKAYRFPHVHERNATLLNRIKLSHSVSIHVRRGDYLRDANARLFGDIATETYYHNAIDQVRRHHDPVRAGTLSFFVFSDDLEWCRQNLQLDNAVFVNMNQGEDAWMDMVLMAQCKINIIANSTFSWWAAWLNDHSDKLVLCPTTFVNTGGRGLMIYPPTWQRISGQTLHDTHAARWLMHARQQSVAIARWSPLADAVATAGTGSKR